VVAEPFADLKSSALLQGILGYLNFAAGKADPRFQKQLNELFGLLARRGAERPWQVLYQLLNEKLGELSESGSSAFRDVRQARAVLELVFVDLLSAYRRHHADLLGHLQDSELYKPFFLARACEAVLSQNGPWEEKDRIIQGALAQLNDYVGHRPIAILETRPKAEPYEHERIRPIPLFIRGAGLAWGRYHDLVGQALTVLEDIDPSLADEASLDIGLLDELCFDPRAYDHGHPANRRPNYVFGEWDPHHLDEQGRYRRYVVRQITLEALLDRVARRGELDGAELVFEAGAVLAGTILMASGMSGGSPSAHDSTTTLSTLMPKIAGYRDAFYTDLLKKVPGTHGERLREESTRTRQPFGGARQHLNQYLAQHRATQLQQRQVAILFAEMGYPEASQREADKIQAASVRMLSAILGRLSSGNLLAERGDIDRAADLLAEAEDLLQRGIACGAFVDPWNILGFQGLFPLFTAREDSIHDPRIDELIYTLEQIFNLYARFASEAAATGAATLSETFLAHSRRLADWWDRFASTTVSGVRRVHGGESVASAEHVSLALARWHERGETTADLSFWREHLEGFRSPKAFALVVEALMRKKDYRASMALLMNWLGQAEQVPLEEGDFSYHTLALHWMLAQIPAAHKDEAGATAHDRWPLIKKFFDYLEANAEEYWHEPGLETGQDAKGNGANPDDKADGLYSAAYADVTFRDSAQEHDDGALAEDERVPGHFHLESESVRLPGRLRFLSTLAQLWQLAARQFYPPEPAAQAMRAEQFETMQIWWQTARANQSRLLGLLDAIHEYPIPEPSGSYESLVEYDRRRGLREQLLYTVINTCLDTGMAVGTLTGVLDRSPAPAAHGRAGEAPAWEGAAIELERALLRGDAPAARSALFKFLPHFRDQPLLFTSLADGGEPRQILHVRAAQTILRALAINLPRLGLLRETYHLLSVARAMEQSHPLHGRGITEFNHLFQSAYQAVIEASICAARKEDWTPAQDQEVIGLLERLTRPFLALWVEHSQTLQLSTLERVETEEEWQKVRSFVQEYGDGLFHAKFMTPGNLRGILHRGVGAFLDYLGEDADPLHPVRLVEDLDVKIPRTEVIRLLQIILPVLLENYEEYKDYNTTSPHSDYGQNLHLLLDFLRLKATYERHAWRLRPLILAHEVLARRRRVDLAIAWEDAFVRLTGELADRYVARLAELESVHGMRLQTVADVIKERFVKPLPLDRLAALIEPAMQEARRGETGKTFSRLEQDLQPMLAQPTGVGLDVPGWLRRLEHEVRRVRNAMSSLAVLAQDVSNIPRRTLTMAELRDQVENWEHPPA
jgi:hypothetical protein